MPIRAFGDHAVGTDVGTLCVVLPGIGSLALLAVMALPLARPVRRRRAAAARPGTPRTARTHLITRTRRAAPGRTGGYPPGPRRRP